MGAGGRDGARRSRCVRDVSSRGALGVRDEAPAYRVVARGLGAVGVCAFLGFRCVALWGPAEMRLSGPLAGFKGLN